MTHVEKYVVLAALVGLAVEQKVRVDIKVINAIRAIRVNIKIFDIVTLYFVLL